jgi:3-hydroxyisobutyrate dehydrogenase-like beta-hydroxyacid dehydrogenase
MNDQLEQLIDFGLKFELFRCLCHTELFYEARVRGTEHQERYSALMSVAIRLGFAGFGEAGFHIAKGLRAAFPDLSFTAFDIAAETELVQTRAAATKTKLAASNADLAAASDVIISVVTAPQAVPAAEQTAPYLNASHIYADFNSVAPASKQAIAQIIAGSDARFVEVAVMAPVPPYDHKVPLLAGGPHAAEFAALLTPFGMKVTVGAREIGRAAATKMCRSIVVKGLESLLTECVMGASVYGAEQDVFRSLAESFPAIDWQELATYMVGRVVVHGERRAREMEEVAAMLQSVGIEPIMADAAARRMDWSARLGLKARFSNKPPASLGAFTSAVIE